MSRENNEPNVELSQGHKKFSKKRKRPASSSRVKGERLVDVRGQRSECNSVNYVAVDAILQRDTQHYCREVYLINWPLLFET